jgi:hypothetical protein
VTGTVGRPCVTVGGSAGVVVGCAGAACVVVTGGAAACVVVGGADEVVLKVVWVVGGPPAGEVTVRVVTEIVSPGAGFIVRVVTWLTVVVCVVGAEGGAVTGDVLECVEAGDVIVVDVELALVVIVSDELPASFGWVDECERACGA